MELWEVALVKAFDAYQPKKNDQDILPYFTRPTRSINHRLIGEIRSEKKFKPTRPASKEALNEFLATWPNLDPKTGLSLRGDELLIKAREAMIAAVHTFNSAGLHFRAELFIVTAVIAWTYLMHAYFKSKGVDYRHYVTDPTTKKKVVAKTREGADRYLELGACIKHQRSPLATLVAANLEYLIDIRHEIEHRSTDRIDEAISAALQACCLNFNSAIQQMFGEQYGLDRSLSIALQFARFDVDQKAALKRAANLPKNLQAAVDSHRQKLTDEEFNDPEFSYRVLLVRRPANRASAADEVIHFVDDPAATERVQVFYRDTEKQKYGARQIINMMRAEGFPLFNQNHFTRLWQERLAKDPKKGFGAEVLGQWGWYASWLDEVRQHCAQHADLYRNKPTDAQPEQT